VPNFSRFVKIAALSSGEQLNYANVANDTGLAASSVRSYFEILADTFVGFRLDRWRESKKRKAVATAKFYFFDAGVANFLRGVTTLHPDSAEFGAAFEHFIAMELRSYLSYRRAKKDLTFRRTQHGAEVDFLIGTDLAVEAPPGCVFLCTRSLEAGPTHVCGHRGLPPLRRAKAVRSAVRPFADVPDALEALHFIPCGILPVVFVAELGTVAIEDGVQHVAAAAGPATGDGDRRTLILEWA